MVEFVVTHPPNRQLILDDAEKLARMEGLIWSLWPISQREVGQQNDALQFRLLYLPSKAVTVPTLLIHGTEDSNVPFTQSRESPPSRSNIGCVHLIKARLQTLPNDESS